MEYEDQLRSMFLRFPHKASAVKIYLDPSIAGCDKGWVDGLGTYFTEVSTPEEADYIPIWLDYKQRCSDSIWNWVAKYPEKCLHSVNFFDAINAEMPDITDKELQEIENMLGSRDWESIYLGLSTLRTYYLTDEAKNLIRILIDTFQSNCMANSGSIIPFGKKEEDRVTIGDIDLIRYYNIWLHNTWIKI